MVSNQEKVMIIRNKIKVCKKKSQKISTHLLTWLKTVCYIISRTKEDREKEKK